MTRSLCFALGLSALAACGTASTPDAGADGSTDAPSALTDAPIPDAPGCVDADHDGHPAISCGGDDCNDSDPHAFPGNPEVCDATGHDEDCNPATLGPDADHDGFVSTMCCNTQPTGTLLCGTDCDDTRATVNPSAVETCNTVDDNCNDTVDESGGNFLPDCDVDGYGDMHATAITACIAPALPPTCAAGGGVWISVGGDCNDTNHSVNPAALELCNGIDDNCDGTVDEHGASWWPDCDLDTYGDASATPSNACPPPLIPCGALTGNGVTRGGDCNDHDAAVQPMARDICNHIDDDCDGTPDEMCTTCTAFCMQDLTTCTGANVQFSSLAACMTTCMTWTGGFPGDTGGNSLECRAYQLAAASMDPVTHCRFTGATSSTCS